MMNKESLRIFSSLREYLSLFILTFKKMSGLRKIKTDERLSPRFREKIMLAVSGVTSCAYCSYLHAKLALEEGIDEKEIEKILKRDITDVERSEIPALLFAQHFAETGGAVSEGAERTLVEHYGESRALQIQAFAQSVLFGNLCCNTVVSFREGRLEPEEKKGRRLAMMLSTPVAAMIRKRSGIKS
ncbi:MAG: carboxymuconolactone decarboxylase family protein [Spirochaetales bacterium]|nr:carboxymuconolactone decarboxylase family protein [Spirochaetales bacterium]